MELNPESVTVCGEDVNRLDFENRTAVSGLRALVDFPTRGAAILDNCLTNNGSLFSKCYPFVAQMTTNHKGVILPPGIKLKPVRFKYIMPDYREHCKIAFQQKVLEHDWHNII